MWSAKILLRTALGGVLLGIFSAGTLFGQSLAELARQERARASQRKPAKVYTNEDIPGYSLGSTPAPAPAPATDAKSSESASKEGEAKDAKDAKEAEGAKAAAKPAESKGPTRAELEKEYRDRFAKLRENLAYEQKKLDVLQRELNLMQMQYYSDPNTALREQTSRGQINQRTQEIEQQKVVVEKAQNAIADLEEELRKKDLPPGWAR